MTSTAVPLCRGHNYHVFSLGADRCSICSWRRFPEATVTTDNPDNIHDLSDAQVTWLELLHGPPSIFCGPGTTHWNLGGVRAFTYGQRSVAALEKKELVSISADYKKIEVTEKGRQALIALNGPCGDCDGDGWECPSLKCKSDHQERCKHARTCQSCDGRGF